MSNSLLEQLPRKAVIFRSRAELKNQKSKIDSFNSTPQQLINSTTTIGRSCWKAECLSQNIYLRGTKLDFAIIKLIKNCFPVFWLDEESFAFPPAHLANEDGLLALGGDLSPQRLLNAYHQGVFPWFSEEDPILWWTPDPRFVLYPSELKVSKSMRPYFNQKKFTWSLDQDFRAVITNCQQMYREGQGGTWITEEMLEAYCTLHNLGFAHSVEVWDGGKLVGGLYGIALGKVFFGESMFAKASNASKFGFIALVKQLESWGYTLIDCQQETQHLGSLGAKSIARVDFLKHLKTNPIDQTQRGAWKTNV